MLVAGSFSINALALWVLSGKGPKEFPGDKKPAGGASEKLKEKALVTIQEGEDVALIPKAELATVERKMFVPAAVVLFVHLASCIPLWALTHLNKAVS